MAALIDRPLLVAPVPNWVGACRGRSDLEWFPEEWVTRPTPEVELVCAYCPFQSACLQTALDNPETDGIWGGTTPYQRRQLLNERNRSKCPNCRSDAIIAQGRSEICISCAASWPV